MRRAAISIIMMTSFATTAYADACSRLYVMRNSIYKENGYCFHTERAIEVFGNAGCQYDDVNDVPLSLRQKRELEAIRSEERALGCPS